MSAYRPQPPLLDCTYSVLGWLHRSSHAVGSDRFAETIYRAQFYLERARNHAHSPGERVIVTALAAAVDDMITANATARVVLADSVSGMDAVEATEFVELCEAADETD